MIPDVASNIHRQRIAVTAAGTAQGRMIQVRTKFWPLNGWLISKAINSATKVWKSPLAKTQTALLPRGYEILILKQVKIIL